MNLITKLLYTVDSSKLLFKQVCQRQGQNYQDNEVIPSVFSSGNFGGLATYLGQIIFHC